MTTMLLVLFGVLTLPSVSQADQGTAAVEPVISVWYRGTPAGVPQQDDLALIRARGFSSVTWPAEEPDGLETVRTMAEAVGISVIVRARHVPLGRDAREAPLDVDVLTSDVDAGEILALVWRAIARGTRIVSFDPGQREGTGLAGADGNAAPWVAPAIRLARHLSSNAEFVSRLKPGPELTTMRAAPRGFEALLLDGGRAWVLVATNLSPALVSTIVRLPPGVPYGLWINLLDGTEMSMLSTSDGPRWSVALPASGVLVYAIEKEQR
jgi:hypothetical protein